jgi:hypothetical protein
LRDNVICFSCWFVNCWEHHSLVINQAITIIIIIIIIIIIMRLCINVYKKSCPQATWCDDKGFEICTAGLEFESGRAPLIRAWDNRSFTRSPKLTKCAFPGDGVFSNPKKSLRGVAWWQRVWDLHSKSRVWVRACTSCKSLRQPGFYLLTWAHKNMFFRGGVSSNKKKL